MSSSASFAARILETGASAYAGAAASALLDQRPELAARYAPTALRDWKSHLQQRVLELSAALDAGEPRLFSSRVRWEREAFLARRADERDLRSGLACLRQVLSEELPESARDPLVSYLESAFETFDEAPIEVAGLDPSKTLERRALQYLDAALRGEGSLAIGSVVDAVGKELSIGQAYEILLAAQREVGRLWHVGELVIAEEHVVTAITERATSVLAQLAPRQPGNGKTAVVAAVADNRHGLAVRILADFFEFAGWRSISMGVDVPATDLAAAAVHFDADLLALSVALPTQLKTARRTIAAVRELPDREVKILLGGGAFAAAPELWRRLGADGYMPAAGAAVALGRRLVGLES